MLTEDVHLRDLVNLDNWQNIQDLFADVLEITLRTVSLNGELLSKTSRPTRICSEILPKPPSRDGFCGNCILNFEQTKPIEIKEKTALKCLFGLDVFVIPIKAVGNKIVAFVVVGPIILRKRKDAAEYAKEAEKIGIDVDGLMDALIELNVFTYNRIYSINRFIEYVFSDMVQTGYHKKRLAEIAPKVVEMDPLFARYYEEKIFNALLNACTIALDADSGSVMTVDKKTHMLHIKVASKLDEDVVNKTKMKIGEGIAGFAAATAQPIILPKDGNKNGLSGKLKREYIKSSMVVPFKSGDSHDLYGVINLNIVRKDKDFSEKDIALVKELVNLASIALTK